MSIMITDEIKTFWNDFIQENPQLKYLENYKIDAWSFGNTPEMADTLVNLVLEGKKTATCSLLRAYQGHENEIPRVGVYSLICNGREKPMCIVFYTDTFICKFNEVSERHAYEEGEGDQSLDYWKRVHLEFFTAYGDFQEDEHLICERFKVLYRK